MGKGDGGVEIWWMMKYLAYFIFIYFILFY